MDNSPLVVDINEKRFGQLLVIKRAHNDKQGNAQWLCQCDCGNQKVIRGRSLREGRTRSCGCLLSKASKDRMVAMLTKHGHSGTRLYRVYYSMLRRCNNPKEKEYHNYGGRGIAVCKEWESDVGGFIAWALANGYQEGLQIDRVNNSGNYEPGNCRFVTGQVNCQNTRKCVPVKTTNTKTLEVKIFPTITAARKSLGICEVTLRRMLNGIATKPSDFEVGYL